MRPLPIVLPNALLALASAVVLLFLVLPIAVIAPLSLSASSHLTFPPPALSLRWYEEVLRQGFWVDAIRLSLLVAILTTALSLTLGLGIAVALVRGRFAFKKAVYVLIIAPMIVPGIITAIALFFFFSALGLIGNPIAIALGQTVLALPVASIILSATLQGFDERLEQAAVSLGASPLLAFRRITVPVVAPGVVSAGLFAFLTSFDELLIPLFLSSATVQMLPVRIWTSVQFQIEPTVAAVSTLLVGLTVVVLVSTQLVRRVPHARAR